MTEPHYGISHITSGTKLMSTTLTNKTQTSNLERTSPRRRSTTLLPSFTERNVPRRGQSRMAGWQAYTTKALGEESFEHLKRNSTRTDLCRYRSASGSNSSRWLITVPISNELRLRNAVFLCSLRLSPGGAVGTASPIMLQHLFFISFCPSLAHAAFSSFPAV